MERFRVFVLFEGRRKVVRPKLAYPLRLMGLIINHLTHTPHSMDYIVNTLVASNPPPNTEAFWFPQNKSRVCRLLYKYVSVKVPWVSVWPLIIQIFFQKKYFFFCFQFLWILLGQCVVPLHRSLVARTELWRWLVGVAVRKESSECAFIIQWSRVI